MTILEAVTATLGELPPNVAAYVRARIRWETRLEPNAADLELGAHQTDRGLFVGRPVRGDEDEEGGELYEVDGEDIAQAQGAPEYSAAEGDDFAEVSPDEPGGVIVLFAGNIRPLNKTTVAAVVLHELAHFFGETEEGVFALGLADDAAEDVSG
jgi:Zn-dependent protease with chaperone function